MARAGEVHAVFARTPFDSRPGRSGSSARGAPGRDLWSTRAEVPGARAAARVIYRETELDCAEARDLVGLSGAGCCG